MPAWANHNSGHTWSVILLPNGTQRIIWFESVNDLIAHKAPKIYRKVDILDENDILWKYRQKESIPVPFSSMNLEDVTADYGTELSDVAIDNLRPAKSKLLWLSVFDDFNWQPVAYGEVKGRKAVFRDVGRGIDESVRQNKPMYFSALAD